MIADHGGEQFVVGGLFEGAPQSLSERRVVAVRRQRSPELGEAAVPERLRGAHDGRITGSELLRERGGRQQRRFGP